MFHLKFGLNWLRVWFQKRIIMELTKNIKRQIRVLASLLYEKELNTELAKLDAHFEL